MKSVFHLSLMIFAAILGAYPAYSASAEQDYLPRCGGLFNLCGYVERGTNVQLIPARFERAFKFSQGLAAVRIDGSFGFINPAGNVVVEPTFDLAGDFHQGLAEVAVDGVVGVIDRTGQFVVKPQFARAIPFTADVLVVAKGSWPKGHFSGRATLPGLADGSLYFGSKRVGLYHVSKGWITDPIYRIKQFGEPARGLIWATTQNGRRGPFGLLRADGTWQVEPTFTHVQRLNEGLAVVRGKSRDREFRHNGRPTNPSGAVDQDGNLVIPLAFSFLSYWNNGYGLAQKDGLHGLVSPDGSVLGGRYFAKVERPADGRLPRVHDGRKWHSIRPDGTLIEDQSEGRILASCPGGLLIREKSGRAEFSHSDLGAPIEPLFDLRGFVGVDCDKPIPVSLNRKWGFVTQTGMVITDPLSFDNVYPFEDGFSSVSLDGLWGILDESGKFAVEPTYDHLQRRKGRYLAQKKGRTFWIDVQGAEISEPSADPKDLARFLECENGARLFAKDQMWGLMGPDGDEIIAPRYRALSCFSKGVAWAAAVGSTAWCPIGPGGQVRQKPECRQTYYPFLRTHHYPEKFSDDVYESSVLWVRAFLDYGRGLRDSPPRWISDGLQGNLSSSTYRQ